MNATQYNQINDLLAILSSAANALERAETNIKTVQLDAARTLLPEYAKLKGQVTDLEAKIRELSDAHYASLFPDEKRTHKTPFGEVKFVKSTSLEFEDAETVVLRIQVQCAHEEKAAIAQKRAPRFVEGQLLRTSQEPNLEVLNTFDDATLALFGVKRERKDNFKVVPFALKTDKPAKVKAVA